MGYVNHVGDVGKWNIAVTLNEHDFFRASLENIGQASLEVLPGRILVVDLQTRLLSRTAINQLHHDGAIGGGGLRLIWRWRLRYQRVQSLPGQRRDHHNND